MGQILNKAAINVFLKSLKIKSTRYNFPEGASGVDASRERVSGRTPGPVKPQTTPTNCPWQFAVTHWSHGALGAQHWSREFTVHFAGAGKVGFPKNEKQWLKTQILCGARLTLKSALCHGHWPASLSVLQLGTCRIQMIILTA